MFLYASKPYTPEKELHSMVSKKINGNISIAEASAITEYLYSKQDCKEIMRRIDSEKEYLSEERDVTREGKLQDRERNIEPIINYKRFQKAVTGYILDGHMTYLAPFNKIFQQFDTDQDGVLSEVEFRRMISLIVSKSSYGLNATTLLVHLDPYQADSITYSACATLLSQIVTNEQTQSTLLLDLADLF